MSASSDSGSSPLSELALLCLDVQPPFLKAVADHERLQRRCAFALQAAVGLGIDVVFTEQVPDKLGGTVPDLLAHAPHAIVFPKKTFSALADETIRTALLQRQHLLLCGVETPICVYQTVLDARAAGLEITLLTDAVGARRPDDARTALDALIRAGAHVLPSETVFYALLHDVSHPFFRAYTQLVKHYA